MAYLLSQLPFVVGIYGLPGCGKTFILNQLKSVLSEEHFAFYEGSEVIASLVHGGLSAFTKLDEESKTLYREQAIDKIGRECVQSGRVGIVTGHFSFQDDEDVGPDPIYTSHDVEIYSHVAYLETHPDILDQRRIKDSHRQRPQLSLNALSRWQSFEQAMLRRLSKQHGFMFNTVPNEQPPLSHILNLVHGVRHEQQDAEKSNERRVRKSLARIIQESFPSHQPSKMLVLDADKTLCDIDTGALFWKHLETVQSEPDTSANPLVPIFRRLGYTFHAFSEAAGLYRQRMTQDQFDAVCTKVASGVKLYPELLSLLQTAVIKEFCGVLIVTCGLSCVWEKVVDACNLSPRVRVIGSDRAVDSIIMTPQTKASIVQQLRKDYNMHVCAFGDSPIDIPMLREANRAIVVVSSEETRSVSMEDELEKELCRGLRASQAPLPKGVRPRLDYHRLPIMDLSDQDIVNSLLKSHEIQEHGMGIQTPGDEYNLPSLQVAAPAASQLLMTPMRDAQVDGHRLREAHQRVGWYLAVHHISETLGVEESLMPHVQGHSTVGYRLRDENHTMIVAIMRAGEPMALGISEAFPAASFLHAGRPEDIGPVQVQGVKTMLLVDSVINTGKTIAEFVERVRAVRRHMRIVIVSGVISAKAREEKLAQILQCFSNVSIVTLRVSTNRYTGRGGTDTGNRLFNTTNRDS